MSASVALDTDLEGAGGKLGKGEIRGPSFALALSRFHQVKRQDKEARRGIKKLIRPENVAPLLEALPLAGDRTHAVLRGDFVLCDLIPAIIRSRGRCEHLRIASLGMSKDNAATLAALMDAGDVGRVTLVLSHYFREVDKTTTWAAVLSHLENRARIVVSRSHAKVILIPTESGDSYVIEGSANLRSSDNLEQMIVFNDPETLAFHADWIDTLAAQPSLR